MPITEAIKIQIVNMFKRIDEDELKRFISCAANDDHFTSRPYQFYFEKFNALATLKFNRATGTSQLSRDVIVCECDVSSAPKQAIRADKPYAYPQAKLSFEFNQDGQIDVMSRKYESSITSEFELISANNMEIFARIDFKSNSMLAFANGVSIGYQQNRFDNLFGARGVICDEAKVVQDIQSLCLRDKEFDQIASKYNLVALVEKFYGNALSHMLLLVKHPRLYPLYHHPLGFNIMAQKISDGTKADVIDGLFSPGKTIWQMLDADDKYADYFVRLHPYCPHVRIRRVTPVIRHLERYIPNLDSKQLIQIMDTFGDIIDFDEDFGKLCYLLDSGMSLAQIFELVAHLDEVECLSAKDALSMTFAVMKYERLFNPKYSGALPDYISIKHRHIQRALQKFLSEVQSSGDKSFASKFGERTRCYHESGFEGINDEILKYFNNQEMEKVLKVLMNGGDIVRFVKKSDKSIALRLSHDVLVGASARLSTSQQEKIERWGARHGILVPKDIVVDPAVANQKW